MWLIFGTFFPSVLVFVASNRQLSIFFNFHFSVYFTVRRGELLNLPKVYRASSVSWRAPTGKWQWLTDQSERAIYFCYVIKLRSFLEVSLVGRRREDGLVESFGKFRGTSFDDGKARGKD